MIKDCNCTQVSEFQNERYGKGKRVMNVSEDGKRAKCTVCGTIRNLEAPVKAKKGAK